MLSWSEKIVLMTAKGMSWKEVQEMDKGLEEEKKNPPKEDPKEEPKEEPEPKQGDGLEPTENEKKLLEKIEELETKLKDAQSDNVHGNNEGNNDNELSFDEQLNQMFSDIRI